jgi:hypothetical protein
MNRFLLLLPLIWTCKPDVMKPGTQSRSEPRVILTSTPGQNNASETIKFSGYNWIVKSGTALGPGPNAWGAKNAWVDAAGLLHLKVSFDRASSKWLCAGITSTENFGHGAYQWQVQGPVSTLDKNVVAGLFHYSGPDGYNELDVEFARWGDSSKPNVNYSVYPAAGTTGKQQRVTTEWMQSGGTASTHRYIWTVNSVVVKSMNGFYNDDTNLFFTHTFESPLSVIPTAKMPVKMNLWCFRGLAPSDGKEVEIVIRSFKFIPAS